VFSHIEIKLVYNTWEVVIATVITTNKYDYQHLRYNEVILELKTRNYLIITYRVIQKEVYTLKIYFTKTTDAKSMFCVRMERKSLKVLI
jgi:hypothetical protein